MRRGATTQEAEEEAEEQDIDDFIDAQLDSLHTVPIPPLLQNLTVAAVTRLMRRQSEADSPKASTHAAEVEYHAANEDESVDEPVLAPGYGEASQQIATYLTTLQKPAGMDTKEFQKFKNYALHFCVLDRHLFRRNSRNVPCRRVIDNEADR